MARIALTASTTARSGVVATYDSFNTGDGNYFTNNQNTILHVKNADAADKNILIISQKTEDGKAIKDQVVTVAAGTERFIGPFSNALYGTGGLVYVDSYSAAGITFDNTTDVASGTKDTTSTTVAVVIMGSL